MKRKLLLVISIMATLLCLFAISVSAAEPEVTVNGTTYSFGTVKTVEGISAPTAIDATSRVLVKDSDGSLITYPAYYFTPNSGEFSTGNLIDTSTGALRNVKVQKTDGTEYTASDIVMLEIPQGVWKLTGDNLFQKFASLLYVSFPASFTSYSNEGHFYNNPALKVVDFSKAINLTSIPVRFFSECKALDTIIWPVVPDGTSPKLKTIGRGSFSGSAITSLVLPEGVTSIAGQDRQGGAFEGCKSLKSITFPSTFTSIGVRAFASSGIETLKLPNTVTSIGKAAFSGCTSLHTFSFGASFTTFARSNYDYEVFSGCSGLKYVYAPIGFLTAVSGATSGDYRAIFNSGTNVTFFFTGEKTDAETIVSLMAATGHNATFNNMTIEAYDKEIDYTTRAKDVGGNLFVYGYSACDAFYAGQHTNAVTYGFDGEDKYTSNFCMFDGCTRCPNKTTTSYGTLFTNKGYSKEQNGTYFVYGVVFNKETIALYLANTEGATLSYGLVAAKYTEGASTGELFDENGAPVENCVAIDATTAKYSVYSLKITDLDKVQNSKSQAIYCCAYIIDNGAIKYVTDEVTNTATTICYDNIDVTIEATAPATSDDQ